MYQERTTCNVKKTVKAKFNLLNIGTERKILSNHVTPTSTIRL